jgi:hypothetical protein
LKGKIIYKLEGKKSIKKTTERKKKITENKKNKQKMENTNII